MSEIKMPSDDVARLLNTKAVADRTVHPVEPATKANPVQSHEEVPQVVQPAASRKQRRRQGERRRKDERILLDTRSGDDRRGGDLTDDVAEEADDQPRKGPGIDVFV